MQHPWPTRFRHMMPCKILWLVFWLLRIINSSQSHRPVDRDVQRLDDERVRFSWRRHWNHGFCLRCSRRFFLCHQALPMNKILLLDRRDAIPKLVCHLQCANLWLHNRICNWLVPKQSKNINFNFVLWHYVNDIFSTHFSQKISNFLSIQWILSIRKENWVPWKLIPSSFFMLE